MSSDGDHDAIWRRPAVGADEPASGPEPTPAPSPVYTGPPPTVPPPAYRIEAPLIQPLPPPRALPHQDHAALDEAERQARQLSYGVAIVMGTLAVLLVLFIAVRGFPG